MHTSELALPYNVAGTARSARHFLRRGWSAALSIVLVSSASAFLSAIERAPAAAVDSVTASPVDVRVAGVVTSFTTRHSHNRRYSAEVVSASPIALGAQQSWTIHLARHARRVSRAAVSAEAWMPETGERAPTRPSVRYVGNGDYRLDGLVLDRAGWWNVALVIDARYGTDSLAFNLIVPQS